MRWICVWMLLEHSLHLRAYLDRLPRIPEKVADQSDAACIFQFYQNCNVWDVVPNCRM